MTGFGIKMIYLVTSGLVSLIVLLASFPSPSSTLPLINKSESPSNTESCVNPEECCKFVGLAEDFNNCCKDHGCCPLSCHGTLQGKKARSRIEYCEEGWECCLYDQHTPEFHQCCSSHGCCPPCVQVSKGCCLNGMRYEWGSIIEEFPEICLEMVCAAEVSISPRPFFNAVIVPVALKSPQCEGKICDDCLGYKCVDRTGLVRHEGASWEMEGCRECECRDGTVTCRRTEMECQSKPFGHCVEIPGLCCPKWDCPIIPPDCSAVLCPGPPEPNCKPITVPGECCAVDWQCPDCSVVRCGGPPQPNCHPIIVVGECCASDWECPDCSAVLCPAPPEQNCRPIIPQGECCAVDWVCPDCSAVLCEGPPQPNCHPIIVVGECCASDWECPDCSAVLCPAPPEQNCRPIIPQDECCAVDWVCPDCSAVLCPAPPEQNCRPIIPQGECCAVDWVCPNCSAVRCGGPPQPNCHPIIVVGECCASDWECGCVDRQGTMRDDGESWKDPKDPCFHCFCSYGEANCFIQSCAPPPPWPCFPYRFPGHCCPNYCDGPEYYLG